MAEYHCTYKKVFPVDEFGRPGGFYSLADLPIMEHKQLHRNGIIIATNEERQYFKIRDVEKNFIEWVPMGDVTIGSEKQVLLNE